jgi:hypothetical protein
MLGRASQLAPDNRFIRNNLILGLHLSGQNREAEHLIDTIAEPAERQKARKLLLVSADTAATAPTETTSPAPKKAETPDTPNAKTNKREIKS